MGLLRLQGVTQINGVNQRRGDGVGWDYVFICSACFYYYSRNAGDKMTKHDLAVKVSSKSGLSIRRSKKAVDAILNEMRSAIGKGEGLVIRGLGEWKTRDKRPRLGRNPKTGEDVIISARKVVLFKASNKLKGEVNDALL